LLIADLKPKFTGCVSSIQQSAISNQQSAISNRQSAIGNQQSEISLQASAAGTVLREKLELTGDRGV